MESLLDQEPYEVFNRSEPVYVLSDDGEYFDRYLFVIRFSLIEF